MISILSNDEVVFLEDPKIEAEVVPESEVVEPVDIELKDEVVEHDEIDVGDEIIDVEEKVVLDVPKEEVVPDGSERQTHPTCLQL